MSPKRSMSVHPEVIATCRLLIKEILSLLEHLGRIQRVRHTE